MSLAKVFCSWSIAAVLLLLSIALSNSAESEKTLDPDALENGEEVNGTSNVTLTGNPQIDYIHDPNLPRELNGYNLSDYPFYNKVPKNINFSCDGRKDGFYASVEHKCQIYHQCLFGSRYDFVCANYTAFDQRTFICQFVSDVDCPNSHMFFHRNKDLYVAKTTTTLAPVYDRGLYERRRPHKKPKLRPRPAADEDETGADGQQQQQQQEQPSTTSSSVDSVTPAKPVKTNKSPDYADEDYYEDDYDYPRRPARPRDRRRFRKCRNGRRRGRRCRNRRPVYYDDDDYAYDDDYDYAYYDDARPKRGKKRRPLNAIPAGTSQVTSTSSSETPPPTTTSTTTTTTTTTQAPPSSSSESVLDPLDFDSVAELQRQREEILSTKARRPFRPSSFRPSRQNEKTRSATSTTSTSTTISTTTTTERTRPTTRTTTTTTTEAPQYMYEYEYYDDDTAAAEASSTTSTTTTTPKPSSAFFRGKVSRGGNSAAALLEKQRVQQSIQVRVTEDSGTNTNTIRRRDNSNVQTPTRVATPSPVSSTTSTTTPPATPSPTRPSRFWQRKSTVKSVSTTLNPTTTTTTSAPYYQEYQDYEDDAQPDPPQTSARPQPSNKFQPLSSPQHQYGTSPAARQSYANTAAAAPSPSAPPQQQQQSVTSSRGHGGNSGSSSSSLSSSSYAPRPNKNYAMQQYSQSSSTSNSNSNNNNNNNNYNSNTYHRQRSPPSSIPKPEFISLVDEDYNNPYSPAAVAPTSPSSTRLGGGGGSPGYHQHPIRFFEPQQHRHHQPPAFLFGAASEYNTPQFAFPPRNYPSPSNFQPYGHSTRRFSAHTFKK